ncbi:MAG: acyltransferase [Clostridia bacterium]|nr:acyltransferase [Clostridia bacterium]MBR4540378.1 acyltransferase [Clostridia bacterium]
MSDAKKKSMIMPLQAIRAIACLAVFLYHGIGPTMKFLGVWGVSIFFVLSGFVLVYSYWERPVEPTIKAAAEFSKNKILKLFPVHVIMLILGLIREFLILKSYSIKRAIFKLALTVPLLETWHPTEFQALNSVDWYLSVTLFLYFVFPFLLHTIKKLMPGKNKVFIIVSFIYLIQILIGAFFNHFLHYFLPNVNIKWIVYCLPLYRLGDFTIGCLIGYLFTTMPDSISLWKKKNTSLAECIFVIFTILSWAMYYYSDKSMEWFTYACLFLPFSVSLIAVFAKGQGIVSRLITNRITLLFAGISSYFFLIHRQILHYVGLGAKNLFHIKLETPLLLIIGFALTLFMIALYRMLEKKLQKRNAL